MSWFHGMWLSCSQAGVCELCAQSSDRQAPCKAHTLQTISSRAPHGRTQWYFHVLAAHSTAANLAKAAVSVQFRTALAVYLCTRSTLLHFNPAQLKLIIDSIVWAFRHTERNVAETGLNLLKVRTIHMHAPALVPLLPWVVLVCDAVGGAHGCAVSSTIGYLCLGVLQSTVPVLGSA